MTLRENTERPETIDAGSNMLAGTEPERILRGSQEMLIQERAGKIPSGTGIAQREL